MKPRFERHAELMRARGASRVKATRSDKGKSHRKPAPRAVRCECGLCKLCKQRASTRRYRARMPWPKPEEPSPFDMAMADIQRIYPEHTAGNKWVSSHTQP